MARFLTIVLAALAVFAFVVVTASADDLTAGATVADRCLPCHPRAHVDDWGTSHAGELATQPQQADACTRCHTTAFCDDCHNAGAAGANGGATYATAADMVAGLCSGCHSSAIVQSARKDKAGWAATIDRMVGHGLSVDESQKAAIAEYLAAQR